MQIICKLADSWCCNCCSSIKLCIDIWGRMAWVGGGVGGGRFSRGFEPTPTEKWSFSVYFPILKRPWEVNINQTVFLCHSSITLLLQQSMHANWEYMGLKCLAGELLLLSQICLNVCLYRFLTKQWSRFYRLDSYWPYYTSLCSYTTYACIYDNSLYLQYFPVT